MPLILLNMKGIIFIKKLNMIKYFNYTLLITIILILFAVSSHPQTNQNGNKYFEYIQQYYKATNVPSISAGIMQKGKIVWTGSFGYSNLELNTLVNSNSVYRIASISKTITAVAIMQLVEEKKINLDDDVRKYLPYFPKKRWVFTIRQVLNHTSGIRTYNGDEMHNKINFPNTTDAVNYIGKDSLLFQPGTKYLYSTLSYNLLTAIIEKISGLSFEEYLKRKIFQPAGMTNSFLDKYDLIIPNRVDGYVRNQYREIRNAQLADLSIKYSGGGILSSVNDLLNFGNALLENKLIKKSSLDTMIAQTKLKDGKIIQYGLGIALNNDSKGRFYFGHTGAGTGFVSNLIIFPEQNVISVHLINIRDRNLNNPALNLTELLLDNETKLPLYPASAVLLQIIKSNGIDSAMSFFNIVSIDSLDKYDCSKDELKLLGNDLINMNRLKEAIIIFDRIVRDYPEVVDGYLGLADAYYKDKNSGLALRYYRRAKKLDPDNQYIDKMINQIEKEIKPKTSK